MFVILPESSRAHETGDNRALRLGSSGAILTVLVQKSIGKARKWLDLRGNCAGTAIAITETTEPVGEEDTMQDLMHTARWRWSAAGAVAGYCPSSRTCLLRVALWAAVNLGTIAPVMT